ncbi:cytochrome P450 [Daedalea quercina L-15889]|uniref:Cytochrome P450 n=1 Tax=Daedalea quercina L-15889 TaxID=1314783 RepID=A0A165NDJ4_9APHY|nr:cytochrome P450 [Daedalea quercina L-15889]
MLDLIIVSIITLLACRYIRNSKRLPIPPGPGGLPLLGNALQIPKECSWLTFTEWAKTFGPIMYLSIIGSPVIVLSSREAVIDLLEKKSLIYSDRPVAPMAGELAGMQKYTSMLSYGHRHRKGRKMMLGMLTGIGKAQGVHTAQEAMAATFISRLRCSPSEYRAHIHWLVAASALELTYGIRSDSSDDPYQLAIVKAMEALSETMAPGAYLVDAIPSLKYVPEWLPGASFKKRAREVADNLSSIENRLFRVTREQVDRGEARQSFVANFLTENGDATPEDDELCREVAIQIYAGILMLLQTASVLLSFFLIMAQYPHVQRNAQIEVDAVVGDRSPQYSDRKFMPYLEALLKEVYRWNPVSPLAMPHQVRHEDVYAGYRIPAGSTILANTWALTHDPELYPDPDEVIPERYLDGTDKSLNPDPRDFVFGYGRRVCPGKTLADDTVFIVAASVLAAFTISDATSLKGEKIKYRGGIISHPDDFTCTITPRRPVG